MQYQVTSPYIQLLQSKKRTSSKKYDNKTSKGNVNPFIDAGFGGNQKRPSKSSSVEKVVQNRYTQQINFKNTMKEKRNLTQNTDEKLHQSLFVQAGRQEYLRHKPSKSLYYDPIKTKVQQNTLKKWAQMFKPTTHKKKKSKQHNSVSKSKKLNISDSQLLSNFQKFSITDIDSLISLIDHCVMEANQYINTLTKKVEELKQQLVYSKNSSMELLQQMKKLTEEVGKKDKIIRQQQLQIRQLKIFTGKIGISRESFSKNSEQIFEKDKLLETIAKITEQNERLKEQVNYLKIQNQKYHKKKQENKEIYGQIHSKIDILNISIDSKKNPIAQSHFHTKNDGKKGKFIKTKAK